MHRTARLVNHFTRLDGDATKFSGKRAYLKSVLYSRCKFVLYSKNEVNNTNL